MPGIISSRKPTIITIPTKMFKRNRGTQYLMPSLQDVFVSIASPATTDAMIFE